MKVSSNDFNSAKERALRLITFRDHTKQELLNKLKKDYDEEISEEVAERMEELGLIDDEKFAKRYAESLHKTKHLSERGIKAKLIEKGISRDLAEEAVEELELDPQEEIRILVNTKYYKNMQDEKGVKRTIAALSRLGFKWDDIKSVVF